jgi:hypothetical protein
MNKSKGSEIVSLRLSVDLVERLRGEATKNRINLNAQAAMILQDHLELNSPAFAVGLFPFPKKIVSSMIKDLDEKQIEELSKQMTQVHFIDLSHMTPGAGNMESFIKTLEIWARQSGFPIRDMSDGDTRTIIIKHDMGEKWSHFLSFSIREYLGHFEQIKLEIEIPGEMLVIKITNPPSNPQC